MENRIGKQYETWEWKHSGPAPAGSQAEIDLRGSFQGDGKSMAVKGFYAGNGEYRLRFLPEAAGDYSYEIVSDSLGIRESGVLHAEPADAGRHGPVRAKGTALFYADGTRFASFGTTVYALANQSEALIEETLETLGEAPFNKLRTCVFPKHYAYNANNPRFYPFEVKAGQAQRAFSAEGLPVFPTRKGVADDYWDTERPCFAFWEHLEAVLQRLDALGIQADLILFHNYDRWGFSNMSRADNLRYLDYLLRRLAAFPNIWWSMANEYDLCFDKSDEDFRTFEAFIAANDPYGHLLSNHNCFQMWDASRETVSHISFQTKELTRVAELMRKFGKPVLVDECRYEGNIPEFWGNLSGQDLVRSFWRVTVQGGFCTHGETYLPETPQGKLATRTGEKDVVWWAKGGRLNGQSPERIAFLRSVIESLPGPLEPVEGGFPELANLEEEALRETIARFPEDFQSFLGSIARMNRLERELFYAVEYNYEGHCGDSVFLSYLDDQCPAVYEMKLPEDRLYRVDVLDTWEMTRQTALQGVKGKVRVKLPGKPYMAVLAVAEEIGEEEENG